MEPVRRKGVQSNTTLIESYGRQGHPICRAPMKPAAKRRNAKARHGSAGEMFKKKRVPQGTAPYPNT